MKKLILTLIPVAIFLAALNVFVQFLKPAIERFAIRQIEAFSKDALPVIINARHIKVSFLPPAVEVSDIQLVPQSKDLGFNTLQVDSVQIRPDLLQLLGGRFVIGKVAIYQPNLDLDLDIAMSGSGPASLQLDPLFRALKKVPLNRVTLLDSTIHLSSKKQKFRTSIWGLDALILNQNDKLAVKLDSKTIEMHIDQFHGSLAVRADTSLNPRSLEIYNLQVMGYNSFFKAKGELHDLQALLQAPTGTFSFESRLNLSQLDPIIQVFHKIPQLTGSLDLKGELDLQKNRLRSAAFAVKGTELFIGPYELGSPEFSGNFQNDILSIPNMRIEQSSTSVDVSNFLVAIKHNPQEISIAADLDSDFFDLNQLLISVDVGDIPLELILDTKLKCNGFLAPQFKISCGGQANADFIEVRTEDRKDKKLLLLRDFSAKGDVTITGSDVTYKANALLNNDIIESEGRIGYADGFKIKYKSDSLNLKNLAYLHGFQFDGILKGSGQTTGNSRTAQFYIDFESQGLVFEDYLLGNPGGHFRYDKSTLFFENVVGVVGASQYAAQFSIDLHGESINLQSTISRFEIPDLIKIFEKKIHIPVDITGTGKANLVVQGPLQFNKLSYSLQAEIPQGTAVGESFQDFHTDIKATNGEVIFENTSLRKGSSLILGSGKGHPSGQVEFLVQGKSVNLDESENISKLGANILGQMDFSLQGQGHISSPDFQLKAQIGTLSIEEQDYPDSSLAIAFNKKYIEGTAYLFGNRLTSEFKFPVDSNDPFHLKMQAYDWNYATMFALVGGGSLFTDYQAQMSGYMELDAEKGGIFNSTGKGSIQKFLLRRGSLFLSNDKPMEFTAKNGQVALKNFRAAGDAGFIEVTGDNFSADNLDLRFKGDMQLRLLQIFAPFLEEVSGVGKTSVSIGGKLLKPEILGAASVENAVAKIKNLPHAFERLNGTVQFSRSKVLFNKFTGNFAGGTLTGDGNMTIEGVRNIPTNIRARAENLNLAIPQNVQSTGSADLTITGSWFPFTLAGTYVVNGGLIDKEFEDATMANQIKPSSFLPKTLLQTSFEPLELDLTIDIQRNLRVKNSLADAMITGNLQVKGTPNHPSILGKINLEKNSKIFAKDKTFELIAGNLAFNDPLALNPELYVSAKSRVSDYDVNLLVQGTSKAPLIRLSSVPPLPETDLISLLALGMTSTDREKSANATDTESNSGYAIGTAIISNNPLTKQFQEKLGLDLNFSSNFDDTRNTTVQKITLGRKISEKLSVAASRLRGKQTSTEVKAQYSFNPNVSAVATFERPENNDIDNAAQNQKSSDSIFGLDLEFKREFK